MLCEPWHVHPGVSRAVDSLLAQASCTIQHPIRYVLQLQGPPLGHDASLSFVHVCLERPVEAAAYTVVAQPNSLPFCAGRFDVVVAFFPYETLGDGQGGWGQEVARIMRLGGWLLVFGVNPLSLEALYSWFGLGALPVPKLALSPFKMHDTLVGEGFMHYARYYAGLASNTVSVGPPYFSVGARLQETDTEGKDWSEGLMMDVYRLSGDGWIEGAVVA